MERNVNMKRKLHIKVSTYMEKGIIHYRFPTEHTRRKQNLISNTNTSK